MDLVKLITKKLEEVSISGKLEEIIEKHVLDCLNGVVSDSFKWSGEAKKQIEESIKGKLGISLNDVKIPQYHKMVSDIVNKKLNDTIVTDLQADIENAVNEITGVLEKKEWMLSEIMKEFTKALDTSYDGEMDDQYGECSLHVKVNGDFIHVRFDKDRDKEYYQCENSMHIYKQKLSSVTIEERPFSPFVTRALGEFEKFMFKLYCSNVTIIPDESNCELDYYREDCD